jgi:beta-N-acetylglucosaminidase/RNase P/RNase MRP subunit p29
MKVFLSGNLCYYIDSLEVFLINKSKNKLTSLRVFYLFVCSFMLFFSLTMVKAEANSWNVTYYDQRDLSGNSVSVSTSNIQFNWGTGAPVNGIPNDNFSARFEKSFNLSETMDYFSHVYADDGVRVEINGHRLIDRWSNSAGRFDKGVLTNLTQGEHQATVEYYEAGGQAKLFAEVQPFGTWVSYYYDNMHLNGTPKAMKVLGRTNNGSFTEDFGSGSPAPGIGNNNFSISYVTAKRIPAGEYIIRAGADDGIRVYIDGQLVLNRWSNSAFREDSLKISIEDLPNVREGEEDVHWIEVQYYEDKGNAKVSFSMHPVSEEVPSDGWLHTLYSNRNLSGDGIVLGGKHALSKSNKISFNWGNGRPHPNLPFDNFSVQSSRIISGGSNYFVHTYADDGVRVKVGDTNIINRWSNSAGQFNQGLITGLPSGNHVVKVDYYEAGGKATKMADVLPLGTWLGYYYNNKNLTGDPLFNRVVAQPRNDFSFTEDFGRGSPATGIGNDNFSIRYVTAQKIPAGEYTIRARADDGVRVYIDGRLVLNRWSNSSMREDAVKVSIEDVVNAPAGQSDIHWIEVHYYEDKGDAKVGFEMRPISDEIPSDGWLNLLYPNRNLSGDGVVLGGRHALSISNRVNFNWGSGSPHSKIPVDNFSVQSLKKISGGSNYFVHTYADDGIRVNVGNTTIFNRWSNSAGQFNQGLITGLTSGEHVVKVDYYEAGGKATKMADVLPLGTWLGYYYNNKNLTGDPILTRVAAQPRNDFALAEDFGRGSPAPGIGNDNFSIRYVTAQRIPAGEYMIKAGADDGIRIYIDGKLVLNRWSNSAYREDTAIIQVRDLDNVAVGQRDIHWIEVHFYEDKGNARVNFSLTPHSTVQPSYLELDLRKPSSITVSDIQRVFDEARHPNSELKKYAQEFIDAQNKYGVNAQYLVAHAILETGWGGSALTHFKNNLYGYGAYDVCPVTCAYYFPNVAGGIEFVAQRIKRDYLSSNGSFFNGYDLPGMNVMYATDKEWANKIANIMNRFKPYNRNDYLNVNPIVGNGPTPPNYGREIPAGQPIPASVITFPSGVSGVVANTNSLNFRSLPYTATWTLLGSLSRGTNVEILGYNTDVRYNKALTNSYAYRWYRVRVNGQNGWLNSQYLDIPEKLVRVTASSTLNVRTLPSTNGSVVGSLVSGQFVRAVLKDGKIETENGWYRVYYSGNNIGWISGDFAEEFEW